MSTTATPFGDPSLADTTTPAPVLREPSIVDTILDLDSFLSGEVRLAEKTGRFCTEPQLEGDIDALELELSTLADANGKPHDNDPALAENGVRTAYVVAAELEAKRHEYAAAFRSVRMRQLADTPWAAFKEKHQVAFASTEPSKERQAMLDDLLVVSSLAPKISVEQLKALRTRVGAPVIDELIETAWRANTESGVSVPKSLLSSAVLRQQARSRS